MSASFDICVIGSGAGGGPVAAILAEAGYSVVILEKGPWYTREDMKKDEIVQARRHMFVPDRRVEPHVWEKEVQGRREAWLTQTGWNGVCVGGATNLMSGFFLRMKPIDFRLATEFGVPPGSTVQDWPIGYDDLAPYYDRVEREIGVSGRVVEHPWADRRAGGFPYPPTPEHGFAGFIDSRAEATGLHPFPLPRAILSEDQAEGNRRQCNSSGWCGSYGCTTGAKGSSREALIPRALATGRAEIRPHSSVEEVQSDETGRATAVTYRDREGLLHRVEAGTFVVACAPIETARLLLLSRGPKHPQGLGNGSGLVGRNLIFSTYASARGDFSLARHQTAMPWLREDEPFVNRAAQDFYVLEQDGTRAKGGTLAFLLDHPNPIQTGLNLALAGDAPLWGRRLKDRIHDYFTREAHLRCEVFADYTPTPAGAVVLDPTTKDRFGRPVARARIFRHPRDLEAARTLAGKAADVLEALGADAVVKDDAGDESSNLVAGTCRFGKDPKTSVLDPDCRAHEVENLYVTDGSFMPTGGSVPYTFTVYANAFRVAERIVTHLGGRRDEPR